MSHFLPARASPPPRPHSTAASAIISEYTDDSRASGAAVPELVGLSPEEIDFIDEVISRASPTASTFLSIFKSYNDVLQERGLDPQNEVVYYRKLLKIGTLKGTNWADKWSMVKEQQGYTSQGSSKGGRRTHVPRTTPTPGRSTTRSTPHVHYVPRNDTHAHHAHLDDTTQTDEGSVAKPTRPRNRANTHANDDTPRQRRPFMSPATLTSNNSLGLDTGPPSDRLDSKIVMHQDYARQAVGSRLHARWDAETTAATETATQASVPPSYGAAVREGGLSAKDRMVALLQKAKELRQPVPAPSAAMPRPPPVVKPPQPPPPRTDREEHPINADEAWKNIRMADDERIADEYRKDRLLERCFEVWKQGYQWIITTGEQISEARDSLILRRTLQHWRKRAAVHRELYLRVAALSDRRCLKRTMTVWRLKFKEKRQIQWREDMRARMRAVRERGELRLKKDAWAKWRQSYRSHLSEQQLSQKLVQRFFTRWKSRLRNVDELDAVADHFLHDRDAGIVERCWDIWRHATELQIAEKAMRARLDLRIMANAMDVWRQNNQDYRVADDFHNVLVVKHTFRRWQSSQKRVQALENRATKRIARQDAVLVRAVMRVWKAHERGKLLTRVRNVRLLRQAWAVWKQRIEEQKERDELAQLFATRSSTALAAAALQNWRGAYSSHQNAHAFAVHYHKAQLQSKVLHTWRVQLRARLRMVKQAKVTQRQLLMRRHFLVWKDKLAERQRERKLKEFQRRIVQQYFQDWQQRVNEQQRMKHAERTVQQFIALRVMSDTLTHWTNRVADIKFRELETAQKYDKALAVNAFKKWKALCKRHADELSLMESYQDIKRGELMRKTFNRWLTAARQARYRKLYLQAREEELKLTVVAAAWDKWRERFLDIRLQPMANMFMKQRQTNLLFRAFAIWHSKSRSLPAVRLHASNLKARFWRKWRDAMPRALQAKSAREMDRRITLSKAFAHWRKAHTTKLELKAIARARFLNLPTAVPRPAHPPLRPPPLSAALRSRITPRRARPPTPSEDEEATVAEVRPLAAPVPLFAKGAGARRGLASLLESRPRSGSPERTRRSPERPKLSSRYTSASRAPSPDRDRDIGPAPARARAPTVTGTSTAAHTGIAAWRRDVRPPKSAPSSVAGDGARSSLWNELREVRRKARAPTERACSPEPL